MKKLAKKITLTIGLIVATVITINAQNFQGSATYQSSRKMDGFSMKFDGMTPDMEEQIKERMKKQFQKEYELKFNLTESIWNEAESLEGGPEAVSGGGMRVMTISAGGNGVTYKNTAENLFLQETEVFSKPFLVSDVLEPREWEITNETKQIGNYTAQKAIFTDVRESRVISFSSTSDGDKTKEETEPSVRMDTIRIEAWFTAQIPVSQGPENYWGLPGLIMEVNDGTTTYICTKVVLNPAEGVKIKRPSKGKKVTREELRAEIDAKMAEMGDKFNNGGKGGATFRIGGN